MTTFATSLVIALTALVVLAIAGLFEVASMYTDAAKDATEKDRRIEDLEAALEQATRTAPVVDMPVPLLSVVPPVGCGNCQQCLVDTPVSPDSWLTVPMTRMIVCPSCGNKRCPKASDHTLACTASNESGQPGSIYGGLPVQRVGDHDLGEPS